jgi:hypothetical protein
MNTKSWSEKLKGRAFGKLGRIGKDNSIQEVGDWIHPAQNGDR